MPRSDAVWKLGQRLGRDVGKRCKPANLEAAGVVIAVNLRNFLLAACERGASLDEAVRDWPGLVERCVSDVNALRGGADG